MKKRIFYTELAYILGLIILSFSAALMERTDFGLSMVIAPAYILHLKVSQFLPFFSFGMAEYTFQAFLLILMAIILRKVKLSFLFSFITAVIYGFLLDGAMKIVSFIPYDSFAANIFFYILGIVLCAISISLLFHTYISPEAYELFVMEISQSFKLDIHRLKTVYDCVSCILAIIMSFAFFGLWHFEGVKIGTVFCALINGSLIGFSTKILDKIWTFEDRFSLRKYF